ncbi:Chloride channel protein A [Nymphon striatum]|nr:Chloride channel protein A [Nymphon striatum]
MMGLIGFTVGFVGFLMHQFIDIIAETKWDRGNEILRPSAGGSGIPELIGYLNGTLLRHIFNFKTIIVKFLSCVYLPFFNRFRNSEDRRNFISAGAAAGVSSAFGAPVGGLLFAMEEVSSFWNTKLSWQTFFCCMVSTFTTDLLNSAFTAFRYDGDFGLFKTNKYILFAITKEIDLNIIGVIPAALIGALGGIFGSLFTFLNLKIQRARRRLISKIKRPIGKKIFRMSEPVLIMIIFGTLSVLLPHAFECTDYSCPVNKSNRSSKTCVFGINTEKNLELYSCPESKIVEIGGQEFKNGSYNQVATLLFLTGESAIGHLFSRNTHYEMDLAPLAVVFVCLFHLGLLGCWFIYFKWLSCPYVLLLVMVRLGKSKSGWFRVTVQMYAVLAGRFIGGLYGRFIGRLFVDVFGIHLTGYWAWIDPGAFSLLGAASFFGGVSRLTMSLTVIMVELTNDIQFLLLIMTSIMVAKWVGDFVTHPLYHALLEFKCIPFLDAEPIIIRDKTKNVSLELFTVKDMMTSPVLTVHTRETVSHLAELLYSTCHSGFPVVKKISPEYANTFCGLITRLEISVLLLHSQIFETQANSSKDEPEVLDIAYSEFCMSKIVDSVRLEELIKTYINEEKFKHLYINIHPYMNQSATCIQGQFSLHRAYIIFRSLGLRHLTIVNQENQVSGIITRKDLMGFMLEERLHNQMHSSLTPRSSNDTNYKMFNVVSKS